MKIVLKLGIVTGLVLGLCRVSAQELPEPKLIEGGNYRGVAFSADSKTLITAGKPGLQLIEAATGKVTKTFETPKESVGPLAMSPDSKWIAMQGSDGKVRVWDVASGKIVHTCTGKGNLPVEVGFTPDSKILVTGGTGESFSKGVFRTYDVSTWKMQKEAKTNWTDVYLYSLALSRDGRIAMGPSSGGVDIYDLQQGHLLRILAMGQSRGQENTCNAVAWRSDGKALIAGGWGRMVNVWNFDGPWPGRQLGPVTEAVRGLAWQPGTNLIVSSDGDRIRLWDAGSGKQLAEQKVDVTALTFSPNGKRLAGGGYDGRIRLWDVTAFKAPLTDIPSRLIRGEKETFRGQVNGVNLQKSVIYFGYKLMGSDVQMEIDVARAGTRILIDGKEAKLTDLQEADQVECTRVKQTNDFTELTVTERATKPGVRPPEIEKVELKDGGLDLLRGFQPNGKRTVHAVPLKAGTTYRITAGSRDFAPWLKVEDAAGKTLIDKKGPAPEIGEFSKIEVEFKCEKDGSYRLDVTGLGFRPGSYSLALRELKKP